MTKFQNTLEPCGRSFEQLVDLVKACASGLERRLLNMWPPASSTPDQVTPAPRLQPFDNFYEME